MPGYRCLGNVPAKRHIQHKREKAGSYKGEGLYYEHIITTVGFDQAYSILYHLRPPTRVDSTEYLGSRPVEAADEQALRHHHFVTGKMERAGDPITGRVPMMFNDDLTSWRCRPAQQQAELYRNGAADEIVFVQNGTGRVETLYGTVPYKRGDYIVIPRMTTYRIVADDIATDDYLIIETFSPVEIPERYTNPEGQLRLGVPYYERDFHPPADVLTVDKDEPTTVLIKDRDRWTRYTMSNHPFDVVGWDGYLYPYTFNAWDFEPLTGTVHLPPPFQQTFQCRGFVVCTFAPRHLDHHPEAVKVPYAHSNVEADEVLFYVDGEFGSRKGVSLCSLTLHPGGIPHGPHPGTIMGSMDVVKTGEMAVMFDTDRPLMIAAAAMNFDDPGYPQSWLG